MKLLIPRLVIVNTGRVIRGGCWISSGEDCRAAYRDFSRAVNRDIGVGFRLARSSRKDNR